MSNRALCLANEELRAEVNRERDRFDALSAATEALCAELDSGTNLLVLAELKARVEALIQHQPPARGVA